MNSPLVYIIILSVLPLILGFNDIIHKEEQILEEQKLREKEFLNALTDNLTGAWNQIYLFMKLKEKPENIT